jgi:hypothetical protein
MRLLAPLLITLAFAGCSKKGESAKMRDVYHCWEVGWQLVEGCYARRGAEDCDAWAEDWFETNKTGVTVLDSNKAFASDREKCAQDAVRGLSVWNQLSAEDITDPMADALQELQAGVKKHDLPAIRTARAKVRQLLDMTP